MRTPEADAGDGAVVSYIEGELLPAEALLTGEGTLSVPRTALRDEIAGAWLLGYKSQNTRKAYARDIRTFFDYCDSWGIDVLTARKRHMDSYLEWLMSGEAGNLTEASMGRKLAAVSSFYKYGMSEYEDDVPRNPVANMRNRPKADEWAKSPHLERAEVERVLAAADERSPWEAALVRLMVYTGIRVSELCTARAADFDPEKGSLIVRRKGGRNAIVAVPADAVTALARYLDGRRSGPLFTGRLGGPLRRDEVAYRLSLLVRAAGITKNITPHSLRHTAATLARESGQDVRDVQKLLGHTKLETTMRYEHAREAIEDSAAHAVARYVRGDAPAP
jgi:site-specific recombinase XerD